MPEDLESSEQNVEEELTDEQLDELFAADEDAPPEEDEADDKEADDEESGDDDLEEDDEEEEEESDDDDEEDEEEDDSPMAKLQRMVASKKEETDEAETSRQVDERVRAREEAIREEVRKEFVASDEIEFNGEKINLAEMREEYGELFGAIEAVSFQLADQMAQKSIEKAGLVSREEVDSLRSEMAASKFETQLSRRHPDIDLDEVQNGVDGEEHPLWAWLDKQSKDIQSFMEPETQTLAGVSAVFAAFKADTIKADNKELDEAATVKKKKHTKLHRSTGRTKATPKKRKTAKRGTDEGPRMSEAEEEELFDDIEV